MLHDLRLWDNDCELDLFNNEYYCEVISSHAHMIELVLDALMRHFNTHLSENSVLYELRAKPDKHACFHILFEMDRCFLYSRELLHSITLGDLDNASITTEVKLAYSFFMLKHFCVTFRHWHMNFATREEVIAKFFKVDNPEKTISLLVLIHSELYKLRGK